MTERCSIEGKQSCKATYLVSERGMRERERQTGAG